MKTGVSGDGNAQRKMGSGDSDFERGSAASAQRESEGSEKNKTHNMCAVCGEEELSKSHRCDMCNQKCCEECFAVGRGLYARCLSESELDEFKNKEE